MLCTHQWRFSSLRWFVQKQAAHQYVVWRAIYLKWNDITRYFFSGSQWILSFCYACKHNCTVQATCHSPHQNDAFDPPPPPKKEKLCRKPKYEFIFVIMYMLNHHRHHKKAKKKKSEFKPSLNTCCALFVHSNIHTISWPQAVTPSRLICLIHMVHTVYFHSCVFDLSAQNKVQSVWL